MKNLTIFASFDKDSIIDEYVVYYVKELAKTSDIIFVSDNSLSAEELKKIDNYIVHSICQKHGEYDFGSYKRGYLWAKENDLLKKYDNLVFCNDSTFGPFVDLSPIFKKFNKNTNVDFWGAFKEKHYIQSFFMVFKKHVFSSGVFDKFVTGITKLENKSEIINKYEVGFTKTLTNAKFKSSGLFESESNSPHDKNAMNIIENGFPFLKKALFDLYRTNLGCNQLKDYKDIIPASYPSNIIDLHLNRVQNPDDIQKNLNKKYSFFSDHILHKRFIRLKGSYNKNLDYKIYCNLIYIPMKIVIPKKFAFHK